MNFIALGFALTDALHNPWLHGAALVVLLLCLPRLLGIVYIPHTQVGIIEKIWSSKGSLREGQIIARNSEARYQAKFLRGGIHFGLYQWQYRIHKEPLVVVAEGKMAYVYALVIGTGVGGQSHFRAGITETSATEAGSTPSLAAATLGFNPNVDTIGVVSIQDGLTIGSGEIIAPEAKAIDGKDHNYFQDPEAFLQLGGKRGKQLQVLTDGTFFINLVRHSGN
jgi:uncharacterized membrane protein YqiK